VIDPPQLAINLRDIPWRDHLPHILVAAINIGGALHNLLAFETHIVDGHLMEVRSTLYGAAEMWAALGMEGHAETVEIGGKPYVLFMCPYSG
jgi:hypothetical protein